MRMMPIRQLKKGILNPKRCPLILSIGSGSLPTRNVLAVIKNMIEPTIVGSILEYDIVTEYLDRINSQFTGSSKTYAT